MRRRLRRAHPRGLSCAHHIQEGSHESAPHHAHRRGAQPDPRRQLLQPDRRTHAAFHRPAPAGRWYGRAHGLARLAGRHRRRARGVCLRHPARSRSVARPCGSGGPEHPHDHRGDSGRHGTVARDLQRDANARLCLESVVRQRRDHRRRVKQAGRYNSRARRSVRARTLAGRHHAARHHEREPAVQDRHRDEERSWLDSTARDVPSHHHGPGWQAPLRRHARWRHGHGSRLAEHDSHADVHARRTHAGHGVFAEWPRSVCGQRAQQRRARHPAGRRVVHQHPLGRRRGRPRARQRRRPPVRRSRV